MSGLLFRLVVMVVAIAAAATLWCGTGLQAEGHDGAHSQWAEMASGSDSSTVHSRMAQPRSDAVSLMIASAPQDERLHVDCVPVEGFALRQHGHDELSFGGPARPALLGSINAAGTIPDSARVGVVLCPQRRAAAQLVLFGVSRT